MTAADITSLPLSSDESMRLMELENTVVRGMDTFISVGTALAEIQSSQLFRATHTSFANYVQDQFSLSRSRAYELISSAATVTELSAMADIPVPANERQARALSGLNTANAAEVMSEAGRASHGQPTAADISAARQRTQPVLVPAYTRQRRRRTPLTDSFRTVAFDLNNMVNRVTRLTEDDRFTTNAATIAEVNRGDLLRARDNLQAVIDRLDGEPTLDTPTSPATVAIEVKANTAIVTRGQQTVHGELKRLGITRFQYLQHKLHLAASDVADVQAALEYRRITVDLIRPDVAADDE